MGNRGVLHNGRKALVRTSQKGKPWITCKLEFKGRRRSLMTPGSYTELFLLDEATAFAAGHRPCAECRRDDFNRFKTLWLRANPDRVPAGTKAIGPIDAALREDCYAGKEQRTFYRADGAALPGGTMIEIDHSPWLLWQGQILRWSFDGYTEVQPRPSGLVDVITPQSVVNILSLGYIPAVHKTAEKMASSA